MSEQKLVNHIHSLVFGDKVIWSKRSRDVVPIPACAQEFYQSNVNDGVKIELDIAIFYSHHPYNCHMKVTATRFTFEPRKIHWWGKATRIEAIYQGRDIVKLCGDSKSDIGSKIWEISKELKRKEEEFQAYLRDRKVEDVCVTLGIA